jgi:hypothetical protein
MIMRTLKQLTILISVPAILAGCDNQYLDLDYGNESQAREWSHWEAREMAVSGLGLKTCDGWNYHMDRNVYPEGEPDFHCTSASNLAIMVANKNDLIEGRRQGNSDANRTDLFTQYYREDKIKALLKGEKIIGA